MRYIYLGKGKSTLIDDEDYEKIKDIKWFCNPASNGYAENRKFGFMHRLIMDTPKHLVVDHKNGNGLDNRRCNLRNCSESENMRNRGLSVNNISGYKGVSWHKEHKRYASRIRFDNRKLHIGYFENPRHAALAYDLWATELHGEFAKCNFQRSPVAAASPLKAAINPNNSIK